MRKSINVETVTSTLVNTYRAKLWRGKVEELVKSVAVASTDYVNGYQQKLKGEIEFANANLDLLSENDYNWLLEQQKSPTVDSTESKRSLSIDSPEFKKALAEAPFVCKIHCDSEELPIVKKPVDSTVKKVRKSKKVYLIQDKKTKQYVTKVDHSNFTEVDLDKSLSEARLYVNKKLAEDDSAYLSRYKDTNCKAQLEVVEMPDDEKFVLWSSGSLEFFVRIDSTGIRTTKNIDEATRYVSYKSASTAVKRTDKELPYRFSISEVKNVKPLVPPAEKPVKKVKEPKVKEEWVLYQTTPTSTFYYQSAMLGWSLVPKLENATKFPSYSAAAKANFKLAKTDILGLEVGESKDFE